MRKWLCQYAYDWFCYLRTCDFQIYIRIWIVSQFSPLKNRMRDCVCLTRVFIMDEVYSMSISVCHMESLSNYTFNWCGCPKWTWGTLSWTSQWVKFCPHWWTMTKLGLDASQTLASDIREYSTRETVLLGKMYNSWEVGLHKPLPGRFIMADC